MLLLSFSTEVIVDDYGKYLTFTFGLDTDSNYFLSPNTSLARENFVVLSGISALVDQLDVAISGRVKGVITADLLVPSPAIANARIEFDISDLNNLIQQKPNAISGKQENHYPISHVNFEMCLYN